LKIFELRVRIDNQPLIIKTLSITEAETAVRREAMAVERK